MPQDPYANFATPIESPDPSSSIPPNGFQLAPPSNTATDPYADFSTPVATGHSQPSVPESSGYEEGFRTELGSLTEQAKQRGEPGLSNEAQLALLDQHRKRAGLAPFALQTDQLNNYDIAEANKANQESGVRDYLAAPGRVAAQLPANLISLVAPETGAAAAHNVDAYFGQPQSRGAAAYGEGMGSAATVLATAPAGPAGMAGIFGTAGAGGVRQDVTNRRAAGEQISEQDEKMAEVGVGLVDAFSGWIGGKIFSGIGGKLAAMPGLRAIVAKEGAAGVANVLKKLAPDMVAQGGQMALNTFADNIVKKMTITPGQDLGEGVAKSAVLGGLLAPLGGALHAHGKSGGEEIQEPVSTPTEETPAETLAPAASPVAAPKVETPKAPTVVEKSAILDTIPANQQDKFAIENALNKVKEPMVKVDVTPSDFADIPRENIDRAKIASYAEMNDAGQKAPPVIAVTDADGNLVIKDGRHRLLAAAMQEKARGGDPSTAKVSAVVPESWAKAKGLMGEAEPKTTPFSDGVSGFVNGDPVTLIGKTDTGMLQIKFADGIKDVISPEQFKQDAPASTKKGSSQVVAQAQEYTQQAGLRTPTVEPKIQKVDPERATRIAQAYDAAQHNPSDPKVKKAYDAFKTETKAQWDFLKAKGVKFEPWTGKEQPYANSTEMQADVAKGHLYYYTGGDMPKDHPLAEKAEGDITYNDMFRAVHDYFGHAMHGNSFGPNGEEAAWQHHSVMYSPEARKAMTAETRGQNSWVNFGPKGEANRANPKNTTFAEQKATLLPDEFVEGGAGKPPSKPPEVNTAAGDEGPPPNKPVKVEGGDADIEDPESRSRLRKIWDATANVFRDPTKGPLSDLEQKIIEAKGKTALSAMDSDLVGQKMTAEMKVAGLDPKNVDHQQIIEAMLRNPAMKEWAGTARAAIDKASAYLAEKLRSVGLEGQAKAVEDNLGTYLKNVPKEAVSPTGRLKDWAKRKVALSPSFGKVKRDKFIVWDGKTPLGKFDTEAEARAAYDAKVKERKDSMIRVDSKLKGISADDLTSRATKGLKLTEPISEEWRVEHEVHDPRYLVARSIIETRHNAEMIDLFKFAAENYGEAAPANLKGQDLIDWAEASGLVKLPESGRLHDLQGTYVPKNVADRLTEHAQLPGEVTRIYRAALSAWKSSKTVYNPGTHARNWATNALVFADLADASPADPRNWGSYKKAVSSISNRLTDKVYRRAVEKGLIGNEYSSTELKAIQAEFNQSNNILDTIFNTASRLNKTVAKSYDIGDVIFKLAIVHNNMRKGMSLDDAIKETDEWMPNYARVGKITHWLRGTPVGAPFVSFLDQSARIAGRAIARKPLKVAKIAALPFMLDAFSRAYLGVKDDEKKILGRDGGLSRWSNTLVQPLIPMRDGKGRLMTLDLQSILPLANDLIPESRNGSTQIPWMFSGPLSNTVIEQLSGKERFTGRNFINDNMTTGQVARERGKRLFDTLAPAPTTLTYGRERMMNAAAGQSEESLSRAILGAVGGINVRTPYIAENVVKKIIQNQIGEKDRDEARSLMTEWNNTYKPGSLEKLTMSDLVHGARAGAKRSKHDARDKAAEALLRGDESEAKQIIDDYNADRPGRLTDLKVEDARRQADTFGRKGKER